MAFWCVVGIMMGDGEVVFINQMKTTIQEGSKKNGVHQSDEHHNPRMKAENLFSKGMKAKISSGKMSMINNTPFLKNPKLSSNSQSITPDYYNK